VAHVWLEIDSSLAGDHGFVDIVDEKAGDAIFDDLGHGPPPQRDDRCPKPGSPPPPASGDSERGRSAVTTSRADVRLFAVANSVTSCPSPHIRR